MAAIDQLLAEAPDTDGVFAFNDLLAVGAIRRFQAAGKRVPDDVAVVGCNDVAMASILTPALTTVRIDRNQLGTEAVNLLRALATDDAPPGPVRLPVELVVRDSA